MIDWWLIEKSLCDKLTDREKQLLDGWLNEALSHKQLYENIKNSRHLMPEIPEPAEWRLMFERKLKRLEARHKKRLLIHWGSVAALFIITLASGYWWMMRPAASYVAQPSSVSQTPDRAKVKLLTAQGKVMNLSNTGKGDTLMIDGMRLVKQSGALSYQKISPEGMTSKPINNQIEVPRGAEFLLTLNDGTKVWLNSDSRLTYPVTFVGEKREVELQGEAYFEVTKDANKPFIVRSGQVATTVLGTEFNMNTRLSENIRVLLVTGSVEVSIDKAPPSLLRPGEMAVANPQTGEIQVEKVNVQKYTAWRYGNYCFEDVSLEAMFEELSLWYDMEVEFQNDRLRKETFSGYLPRGDSIFSILRKVEQTTYVHFSVAGKKIVVK